MNSIFPCIVTSFCGALPLAAAVTAPMMTMNNAAVTPDGKFTNPVYNPEIRIVEGTDSAGFDFRNSEGAAAIRNTTHVNMDIGGGTRTVDSSYTIHSTQRERFVASSSGFRFEASTDIHAGLHSKLAVSTYGNFFFISTDSHKTNFEINRAIRFMVDQPMHLLIQLSGFTSSNDFKGIFNNFQLRGGDLRPLVDNIQMFTVTNYRANETTIFTGSGSRTGIDFTMDGIADAEGVKLLMTLQPTIAGTSHELQLSWMLRNELVADVGPSAQGWNRQVGAVAEVREMIVLAPIPEPSVVGLFMFSVLSCVIRRRR